MSLNRPSDSRNGELVLFYGERLLICHKRCSMSFKSNSHQFKEDGVIYLTSHRLVWINSSQNDKYKSLAMPFIFMHQLSLEQPIFGCNKLVFRLDAEYNVDWQGQAIVELGFKNGGASELGSALRKLGTMAHSNKNQFQPPAYNYNNNPHEPVPEAMYSMPPPYVSPYQDAHYGFIEPHAQFSSDFGNVSRYNAPPPYPGATNPHDILQDYQNDTSLRIRTNIGFVSNDNDPHSIYVPPQNIVSGAYPSAPSDPNEKKNL